MRFNEIIGHKAAVQKLRGMVDSGKIPHALLLHGPSGIGKMTVVRAFVQYLCCTGRQDGDSCGKCPACLQTSKLNNPDLHFIYPVLKRSNPSRGVSSDYWEEWKEYVSNHPFMPPEQWLESLDAGNSRPMIYVGESEEIVRLSSMSAYGNGFKIFVIWLPEKMNAEAANKLLKVIEEPYNDTLFILVSNNPAELIPTVRSRLQSVELCQLAESDIADFLMSRGTSPQEAATLAKIAGGNINKASQLILESGESSQFNADFIGVMRAAYARKMPELKNYSDKFAAYGREKCLRLLEHFGRMVRESFISNLKCPQLESMTTEEKQFVNKFGPFINAANVEDLSEEISRAYEDISRNANQKIVWFDLMIEITRLIRTRNQNN